MHVAGFQNGTVTVNLKMNVQIAAIQDTVPKNSRLRTFGCGAELILTRQISSGNSSHKTTNAYMLGTSMGNIALIYQ